MSTKPHTGINMYKNDIGQKSFIQNTKYYRLVILKRQSNRIGKRLEYTLSSQRKTYEWPIST